MKFWRRVLAGAALFAASSGCILDVYDVPGGSPGERASPQSKLPGGETLPEEEVVLPGTPTYFADVQPIFQKNCYACHVTGGAAQPALDQAATAKTWAPAIANAVATRRMPPFPPEQNCNRYVEERYLTGAEKATISEWAEAGGPAGDASLGKPWVAPPMELGNPDLQLRPAAPFTPTYPGSAGANDLYWCFVFDPQIPAGSTRDLTAVQTYPDNLSQVHHVLTFRDPGGAGAAGKPAGGYECNGAPGEMIAGWVPGSGPMKLPAGVGMTLNGGDKLLVQVHYHLDPATGPKPDRTGIDLFFSEAPTPQKAYVVWGGTPLFSVPPNSVNYAVNSTCTVNGDWKVLGVAPHMHTLGRKFNVDIAPSGGSNQCMMNIPKWDFGWQGGYFLQEPIDLRAGDRITTKCTFDNPGDTAVAFGEATTEEMCFAFLYVVAPARPRFNGLVNIFGGQNAESICAN